MGSAIGVMLPIMPLFAAENGISTAQLGAAVSAMGISRLLFNVPAAWAVEKFGRRPLLVSGPFISAVGMTFTALCTTANELIATRFVTGAGGSLSQAGSQSYLVDISTVKNRARTMAPMAAAFSAGALCGPAIGGFIGESYGLAAPFYFVGGAIFCVTLNNFLMLPETKPPQPEEGEKPKSLRDEFGDTLALWKPLLKDKNIRGILSVYTSYWMLSVGCVFTLMPLLACDRFGMEPAMIGTMYALNSLINIVGSQPIAWVSDKYGRKNVILPGALIIGLGAMGLVMAPSIEYFVAASVLWGIGSCTLSGAPMAYASDVTSDKMRTQALALLRSGGDLGFVLGGALSGSISMLLGMNAAFTVSTAMFLSAVRYFHKHGVDPLTIPETREKQRGGES
jgi:MFS family permease